MATKVIGGKIERRISIDGIGGVFLYANDARALSSWYAHHFGLRLETYEDGKVYGTEFKHRRLGDSAKVDSTVFSISQAKTTLPNDRLKADGIEIEKTEDFDYGRFAWIKDPEGNRIELYQPLK